MAKQHNRNQNQQQGGNKDRRGFAGMDPEKQREIASEGGRASHESGNAHQFSSEEARGAGRKGGAAVSQNRDHMAEIGRKGGGARGGNPDKDNQGANRDGNPRGGNS